jgi:ribonuclease HII
MQGAILDPRERKRLRKMSSNENRLHQLGFTRIAGVDEAGRGPLAGPVFAAACILPPGFLLARVNDSKQLTSEMREKLFNEITTARDVYFGIGMVSAERIDAINILRATLEAMQIAVKSLPHPPDYLLIDGNQLPPFDCPSEAIVQGDAFSISIAAASIIAKVSRDHLMDEEARKWPEYGFEQHKGYGTPQHLEALQRFGPCPLHRRSFEPVRIASSLDLFSSLDRD